MNRVKISAFLSTLLVVAALRASGGLLLTVPAQSKMVDLGFDMMGMRPHTVALVCYSGSEEEIVLEKFDKVHGRWLPMGVAEWSEAHAGRVVLVGFDLVGYSGLSKRLAALREIPEDGQVGGRLTHEVINSIDKSLNFTEREWKRISVKHGLELVDLNAERRKYGRYGRPGGGERELPQAIEAGRPAAAE